MSVVVPLKSNEIKIRHSPLCRLLPNDKVHSKCAKLRVHNDMSLSSHIYRKPFITFPLSMISISWNEKDVVYANICVNAYLFAELIYAKLRQTICELW